MAQLLRGAVFFAPSVICFNLGLWQTRRKAWKEDLIRERETNLAEDPAPLATLPADAHFRRAFVDGEYCNDAGRRALVGPRSRRNLSGSYLVEPFRCVDGSTILVNRGWIPTDETPVKVTGPTRISGIVRRGETPNSYTPPNDPARGTWFWIDLPRMAELFGTAPRLMDLDAASSPVEGYPQGGGTKTTLTNTHLEYMITWYSLSAILALMGVRRMRVR